MKLIDLGWDNDFERCFMSFSNIGYIPARVAKQHNNNYFLFYENGTINAKLSGRICYTASKGA